MRITENGVVYEVEARHDGDFWLVDIYRLAEGVGLGDTGRRHLFEYKVNQPRDADAACRRGWALFKQRHLKA